MLADRSECLDEQAVADFISGDLETSQLSEVEAHLVGCADCREVVADAVHGANEAALAATDRLVGALPKAGELLAEKYRVEGPIGRGGMGIVLAARHVELGHRVAIKILDSRDPSAGARFLREAKTIAQLTSEHVVRVFDLGQLPNGVPYFVMEHLLGEDLRARMDRERVPMSLAIEYLLQACAALREAHAAGVVHRDLKPSNLFIAKRDDGTPCLKVLDFGISKLIAAPTLRKPTTLTLPEAVLGSPLYMSPEQIRGNRAIDARSDIWSLGVILFELLTGRLPFKAPSLSAVLVAIATEPVPSPTSLAPQLPAALDAIVLRCLQKDRDGRFPNVEALVEALQSFLRDGGRASIPMAAKGTLVRRRWLHVAVVASLGLAAATVTLLRSVAPPLPKPSPIVNELRSLTAAPILDVRCDGPLPPGNVRWEATAGHLAPSLEWPIEGVCHASEQGKLALLAQLRTIESPLRASLKPSHPFYSIDWRQDPQKFSLELHRAERSRVVLQLMGSECERVRGARWDVQGTPQEIAGAAMLVDAVAHPCAWQFELPFEAFGKVIEFRLEPPGYSAPTVTFESAALSVPITRKDPSKPHAIRKVNASPPRTCLPPEICRD